MQISNFKHIIRGLTRWEVGTYAKIGPFVKGVTDLDLGTTGTPLCEAPWDRKVMHLQRLHWSPEQLIRGNGRATAAIVVATAILAVANCNRKLSLKEHQ